MMIFRNMKNQFSIWERFSVWDSIPTLGKRLKYSTHL
jgi:hypothetical protein